MFHNRTNYSTYARSSRCPWRDRHQTVAKGLGYRRPGALRGAAPGDVGSGRNLRQRSCLGRVSLMTVEDAAGKLATRATPTIASI